MQTSEAQKNAVKRYIKNHQIKRLVFDVPNDFNMYFRNLADESGESLSTYFMKAIYMRAEADSKVK